MLRWSRHGNAQMQVCLPMCTSVLPRERAVDWGGGEPASLWQTVFQSFKVDIKIEKSSQ